MENKVNHLIAILLVILAFLLGACKGAPEPIEPAATSAPTAEPKPATWLLSSRGDELRLYDSNTEQQVDLALPSLWLPDVDLHQDTGISGTGLLAVRTASNLELPEDIALSIIRLEDGLILRHIPLLSERLKMHMGEDPGFDENFMPKQDVYAAVLDHTVAPHWSPNGLVVAFAAALDGLSTDVYTYDTRRGELGRLTTEEDQVAIMGWSPDGDWVVYSEADAFDEEYDDYWVRSVNAVSTRTGEIREIVEPMSSLPVEILGWRTPNEFAMVEVELGYGYWDPTLVNIATRTYNILPTPRMESIDFDPDSATFAFTVFDDLGFYEMEFDELGFDEMWIEEGFYLMNSQGSVRRITEAAPDEFWSLVRWIPEFSQFFAASDKGVLAFSPEGEVANRFDYERCLPSASPDGRWLAFGLCTYEYDVEPGLRIYDVTGSLVVELENDFVEELVWLPDSEGLYYLMYREGRLELASIDISGGQARTIDSDAGYGLTIVQVPQADFDAVIRLPTAIPQSSVEQAPTPPPAPTEQVALTESGPWIVGSSRQGVIAMNPDGSGRTVVFPRRTDEYPDTELSSAGWVAEISEGADAIPQLHIARLPAPDSVRRIPIMTDELAARRDEIAGNGMKREWTDDVYLALDSYGFMDLMSWSPDGTTLAFIAALDGPSADVYVYDAVAEEIRRLTSGPNQPKLLGWSADSRWVLHLEITDINAGEGVWWDTVALWAAAADGTEVRKVPGIDTNVYLVDWSAPLQFTVVYDPYGPLPPFQFDVVDLDSGPVATLYSGYVYRWDVDPVTGTIAFILDDESGRGEESLEAGLYVASASDPTPKIVKFTDLATERYLDFTSNPVWSPELNAFMVTTEQDAVALVSTAGEIVERIEGECNPPAPSPDGRWLAFESCREWPPRLRVHSEEHGGVIELLAEPINDFFWSPDSLGIYYFQGEYPPQLMYVPVPEGSPHLIHPDSGLQVGYWLPSFIPVP